MNKRYPTISFFLSLLLAACSTPQWGKPGSGLGSPKSTPDQVPPTSTSVSTPVLPPTSTPMPVPTDGVAVSLPTFTPTPPPQDWMNMPVIPQISERMLEVYRLGQQAGRDPAHFSKIGDCQNITTYFLASFDDPRLYRLGSQYAGLQSTIDHFAGSWSRESLAVKGGLNVAAALNPAWADPKQCQAGETPIACEIRVNNPIIVTISMEESWSGDLVKYKLYLRKIVEYVLSQNVIPILTTRAEIPGSSNSINAVVDRVAYDYQVPLWNFGAATLSLPSYGLTEDGFHLTQAANYFDDPASMEAGWPWRNLTALQAIDAVYRAVNDLPPE
jgi:hypothetical protein